MLAGIALLGGCKSEPRVTTNNSAQAAEVADNPSGKTRVTAVKSAGARSGPGAAGTSGAARSSQSAADKKTTEATVVVHGKITKPDGTPAAGVTVDLYGVSQWRAMAYNFETGKPLASVASDAEGMYELSAPTVQGMHLQVRGK